MKKVILILILYNIVNFNCKSYKEIEKGSIPVKESKLIDLNFNSDSKNFK